ncbi:MAG: hypothetical protein KDC54_00760 [Lewinella sp.]|nr:hypothetical protein [Lewinella sp.]
MSIHPEEPQEQNAAGKMLDATRNSYRGFQDLVRFRDDDPLWVLGYKLVLRFFGILFMIILSPFLVIGLTIAFLAVM